jgi:CubicO group peptidase (beta-lactamase class C family)
MERWAEYREKPSWTRRIVVFAVLAGAVWAGVRFLGPDPAERDALATAIDGIVEEAMRDGPISGVSVGVARGARVVYARGYGYADLENQLPATPETVYRVGSITKQFTAAAIMQQVEQGTIRLDAPASEYLPEHPVLSRVTVEQLLNHTSGVRNYTTLAGWWQSLALETDPVRLTESFLGLPFDFAPGRRFAYSNSGYVLLGRILEEVTGRPYGGYLNEFVFVPNRLSATAYCDDRMLVPNRAAGYQAVDDGFVHAPYVSMSQAYSAGGVCSSVTDLLTWYRALTRNAVVSGDSYRRMSTPGTLIDGSQIEYGYGLAVSYLEGHHRVNHLGGMLGFTGQISHYGAEDLTVVVLTNTEGANASEIESDVARVLLGLGDRTVVDIPLSAPELQAYTGRYDLGLAQVDVRTAEGRLVVDVNVPGLEGSYVLLNQGGHDFEAQDDTEVTLTFEIGADDRAAGFVLVRRGLTMHAERVAG